MGQLPRFTGGSTYYYPNFSDVEQGEKLSRDLQHNLTRLQGLEAVLRVRASRGLRIANFYGNFIIRSSDLLALPNVDEDKAFAVEIAHEETVLSSSSACVQAALLYTTTEGERRIRCLTMEVPVTSALTTMFESADMEGTVSLMSRIAADTALNAKLLDGAERLQSVCMDVLRNYRSLCPPQAKNTSQLLLPESLKLLPLYSLALMKSALFTQTSEVRTDAASHSLPPHAQALLLLPAANLYSSSGAVHPNARRCPPKRPPLSTQTPAAVHPDARCPY
eukprot:674839-Pleurochrysis_carterae.AAC.1